MSLKAGKDVWLVDLRTPFLSLTKFLARNFCSGARKQLLNKHNRVVAKLVSRVVWDHEAAGSNPAYSTNKGASTASSYKQLILESSEKCALIYRSGGAMVAHEVHTLETWFESNGCFHSRQGDYQNPWECSGCPS